MEKLRFWLLGLMMRLSRHGLLRMVPDAAFLKVQYYLKLGEKLNLKSPVLYNEKLQWLKLYDQKPHYLRYVDKLEVREYVGETVGKKYLIPEIARYDRLEDVDWDALPNRFVLKCTHGSSSNILCRDKRALDLKKAKAAVRGYMKRNWFDISREWPYKGIQPRILVEEFLESETGDVPLDYKILCFSGEPKYIIVDVDRYRGHKRNYYDTDWNPVKVFNRHPNYEGVIPRPEKLDEMLSVARALSNGLPQIRVDLYAVFKKIYFGEMTFFHGYGMEVFRPREFELAMGDRIKLETVGGGK